MLSNRRLGLAAAALARRLARRPDPSAADLARPAWAFSSAADSIPSDASTADDASTHRATRLAFVDRVHCTAVGGPGGAGCAAFWRSKASGKYGPPDGGNGGRGGDVVIEAVAG